MKILKMIFVPEYKKYAEVQEKTNHIDGKPLEFGDPYQSAVIRSLVGKRSKKRIIFEKGDVINGRSVFEADDLFVFWTRGESFKNGKRKEFKCSHESFKKYLKY